MRVIFVYEYDGGVIDEIRCEEIKDN